MAHTEAAAFPQLTDAELAVIRPLAELHEYADGQTIFQAGQAEIDLYYIVEAGAVEIRNPTDDHRLIVVHGPGQFSGDIDLLTGRSLLPPWRADQHACCEFTAVIYAGC
ncbi:MAG TPA: cyclic nucleotide-binding domain-containing protein, partial [Pirellulales bacterium]